MSKAIARRKGKPLKRASKAEAKSPPLVTGFRDYSNPDSYKCILCTKTDKFTKIKRLPIKKGEPLVQVCKACRGHCEGLGQPARFEIYLPEHTGDPIVKICTLCRDHGRACEFCFKGLQLSMGNAETCLRFLKSHLNEILRSTGCQALE